MGHHFVVAYMTSVNKKEKEGGEETKVASHGFGVQFTSDVPRGKRCKGLVQTYPDSIKIIAYTRAGFLEYPSLD